MGMLIAGAAIMLVGILMGFGMGSAKVKSQADEKNRNHLKAVD